MDLTKTELRVLIKDIFDEEFNKKKHDKEVLTKDDIRMIVRKMLKKQYKTFWERSNLFLDNL